MILAFIPYDEIADFLDLGATSSLEFKDAAAAKKYLARQIETAHEAGKMNPLFAMALFESIKGFSGDSADIYQQAQAESFRLVNIVGVPKPANYDKWLGFLSSAEESALAALEREATATWTNIGAETAKKSVEQAKSKLDPKKSIWPFVIGGGLLLLLLRR